VITGIKTGFLALLEMTSYPRLRLRGAENAPEEFLCPIFK
jgi:hypothetical protein